MIFQFKQFAVRQEKSAMKVGTDGVLLGAATEVAGAKRVLDIGTGTGLVALMLAQRNATAHFTAVEIDAAAFAEASENAENSPWSDRITVVESAIQTFDAQPFDLVVSNPPFFVNSTLSPNSDKNQVRHTTLLPFEDLLAAVVRLLAQGGRFVVILPQPEAVGFEQLATKKGLFCIKKMTVQGRAHKAIERVLLTFSNEKSPLVETHLIIQNSQQRHDYTPEYIALTRDFYLKM
jgi:tRNA1Val (adenine37-N6)-methyltransferase